MFKREIEKFEKEVINNGDSRDMTDYEHFFKSPEPSGREIDVFVAHQFLRFQDLSYLGRYLSEEFQRSRLWDKKTESLIIPRLRLINSVRAEGFYEFCAENGSRHLDYEETIKMMKKRNKKVADKKVADKKAEEDEEKEVAERLEKIKQETEERRKETAYLDVY